MMSPAMFHVLLAIADEPRHGYAIIKDVSARTAGAVDLGTGTLYGIIKRLLAEGLAVESHRRPPADSDDERRRYYRLTTAGREALKADASRLAALVTQARRKGIRSATAKGRG